MTLQEYRDAYLNEADYFEKPTKELAIAWLDAKIDTINQIDRIIDNQGYNLAWGDVIDGEFENEIQLCGLSKGVYNSIHVYNGIDKLADLLEVPLLEEDRNDEDYPYYYYFYYKDKEIYQISKNKLICEEEGEDKKWII